MSNFFLRGGGGGGERGSERVSEAFSLLFSKISDFRLGNC